MCKELEESEPKAIHENEQAVPDDLVQCSPEWRLTVEENIKVWLDEVAAVPQPCEIEEEPDLYSFYEQLCVLRNEFRKNARRSHETFSLFGDNLGEFQKVLQSISSRLERMDSERDQGMVREKQNLLLAVLDVYERLKRLHHGLKNAAGGRNAAPEKPLSVWKKIKHCFIAHPSESTVRNSLEEGLAIALSHFDSLLAAEGVERIKTLGEPFDPTLMTAIDARQSGEHPPHTVIDEVSAGYMVKGCLLKPATVTVSQ